MEMNGNKICDADLSVQMLNDNPMHLKLKKKERKALFFSPSEKKNNFQKREHSLGLEEKLTMTWEDEGRKGMMDFPLVRGKRLGKKPGK